MQLRLTVNMLPACTAQYDAGAGGTSASQQELQRRQEGQQLHFPGQQQPLGSGHTQQSPEVVLELDGRSYRLLLCRAQRMILPRQLASLLPVTLQQQLGQALPGGSTAADVAQPAHRSGCFVSLAESASLPFLSLVFPHACLNMYPLGWKTAAAHISRVSMTLLWTVVLCLVDSDAASCTLALLLPVRLHGMRDSASSNSL
jgi:hypothetical protein